MKSAGLHSPVEAVTLNTPRSSLENLQDKATDLYIGNSTNKEYHESRSFGIVTVDSHNNNDCLRFNAIQQHFCNNPVHIGILHIHTVQHLHREECQAIVKGM